MASAKIGVGIIGATPGQSWAAVAHVPALRLLPGYEIVAVAGSNAASAKAAADALGIPKAHADAAALAHDPAVDLVAVTVKVPHHKALVDAALDAGKMVYCEWPLGNGLAEAEAMAARAKSLGVRTAVGLQARSSPTIRYLRDLVRDGYVGDVLSTTLVGSSVSHGPLAPTGQMYLYDRANGASVLTIPFGHTIDALCWCLGEFTEVTATLAILGTEKENRTAYTQIPLSRGLRRSRDPRESSSFTSRTRRRTETNSFGTDRTVSNRICNIDAYDFHSVTDTFDPHPDS